MLKIEIDKKGNIIKLKGRCKAKEIRKKGLINGTIESEVKEDE